MLSNVFLLAPVDGGFLNFMHFLLHKRHKNYHCTFQLAENQLFKIFRKAIKGKHATVSLCKHCNVFKELICDIDLYI